MKEEKPKKLKTQIEEDIQKYTQQILQLDTQIKHLIGAKVYAQLILKRIEENKEK